MHSRRQINSHANILVGELRIHKGADAARDSSGDSAEAGGKTARGNRDAVPNLQFSGLAINRADFRILDNLRVRISVYGVSRMMMAFCELSCWSRFRSSNCLSPVTISVKSCGWTVFDM